MEFGERLQLYIEGNRISQSEMARRIGCSNYSIESWISGRNRPTVKWIPVLEEIFGMTAKELGIERYCPICGKVIKRDYFKFCDECMKIPTARRNAMLKKKTVEKPKDKDLPMAADIHKQCRFCKFWDKHLSGDCGGCIQILEEGHRRRRSDENGKCLAFERGRMKRNDSPFKA